MMVAEGSPDAMRALYAAGPGQSMGCCRPFSRTRRRKGAFGLICRCSSYANISTLAGACAAGAIARLSALRLLCAPSSDSAHMNHHQPAQLRLTAKPIANRKADTRCRLAAWDSDIRVRSRTPVPTGRRPSRNRLRAPAHVTGSRARKVLSVFYASWWSLRQSWNVPFGIISCPRSTQKFWQAPIPGNLATQPQVFAHRDHEEKWIPDFSRSWLLRASLARLL
jgi:hypothetical protein